MAEANENNLRDLYNLQTFDEEDAELPDSVEFYNEFNFDREWQNGMKTSV